MTLRWEQPQFNICSGRTEHDANCLWKLQRRMLSGEKVGILFVRDAADVGYWSTHTLNKDADFGDSGHLLADSVIYDWKQAFVRHGR